MLVLYYTSIVLLSLGFKANENGLDQSTDKYDRKYLPQYVCIADCVQQLEQHEQQQQQKQEQQQQQQQQLYNESKSPNDDNHLFIYNTNVKFLKICVRYCKQRNASGRFANSTRLRRVQENFRLHLICRDDSTLNFRILFETISIDNDRHIHENIQFNNSSNSSSSSSNNNNNNDSISNIIYVIKISKYNHMGEYRIYVSDETFFTLEKLLPQTIYYIAIMAVHSNGDYSIIAKQQLFHTLRKAYMPNNIRDIKLLKFTNDNQPHHLSAVITWTPGRDMTCFYDIICFAPERQKTDLIPLHIRNPQFLYTYNLHNLDFSTLYKVGIRAKSTKTSKESQLYWQTFHTPSCVDWYNYNFNICAPLEPKNLRVHLIHVKRHIFALNISWQSVNYLPENYTLWIKDSSQNGGRILEKYQLAKNATSFFIPIITLMTDMYEVNLTAFSWGGQSSSIYRDYIKIVANDQSCRLTILSIIIMTLFCISILCTIFIHNYCYHIKLNKKRASDHTEVQNSLTMGMSLELKQIALNSCSAARKVDCKYPRLYNVFSAGCFAFIKRDTIKDLRSVLFLTLPTNHVFHQEFENINKYFNTAGIIGYSIQILNCLTPFTEYYYYDCLANYLRYHKKASKEIVSQLHLEQIMNFKQSNKCQIVNDAFGYQYYSPTLEMMNATTMTTSIYSTYALNKLIRYCQDIICRKLFTHSAQTDSKLDKINDNCTYNALMINFMKYPQVKVINFIHIAKQIAMGKDFLTQHNILQRDLDAFNILITLYGAVKITDIK